MRRDHLLHLACPECHGDLALKEISSESGGRIAEGTLACKACAATFPVTRFVPRFTPAENYASGFGLQWTLHARTQYDSESGVAISEERFFKETGWPRVLRGETVLEVGSGSGRFTEQAVRTGALVISVEYSTAVDANYASNGRAPNVLIVQADLYRLPLRPRSVDRVFCFGVLQHTPDVERAFKALPPLIKRGGRLAVDVYTRLEGWRRIMATKYWVRPLTRRVPPAILYRIVRLYIHAMWPVARLIGRIPRIGRPLNWRLLIADYRGIYPLGDATLREWAVLDTFDMLAPTYDSPQTLATIERWFTESGFQEVDVRYGFNGIEGRGVMV